MLYIQLEVIARLSCLCNSVVALSTFGLWTSVISAGGYGLNKGSISSKIGLFRKVSGPFRNKRKGA